MLKKCASEIESVFKKSKRNILSDKTINILTQIPQDLISKIRFLKILIKTFLVIGDGA